MHPDRFVKKIIKNIKITRNRERAAFMEPDGQQYIAERPF